MPQNTNVSIGGFFSSSTFTIYNKDGSASSLPPLTNTATAGKQNANVVVYNTDGVALWATKMGGKQYNNNDNTQAQAVTLDKDGNVYVIGIFSCSELTIYDAPGNTSTLPPIKFPEYLQSSSGITFLIKYDPLGKALWAIKIGGNINNGTFVQGNSITTDSTGNVYVTGEFTSFVLPILNADNTETIPPLQNIFNNILSFLIKYNAEGQAIWATKTQAKTEGNVYYSEGSSIFIDKNENVYINGIYNSALLYIYNADQKYALCSPLHNTGSEINSNIFIIKYNAQGEALWATTQGGNTNNDNCYINTTNALVIDAYDNLYTTGSFSNAFFYVKNADNTDASFKKYSWLKQY